MAEQLRVKDFSITPSEERCLRSLCSLLHKESALNNNNYWILYDSVGEQTKVGQDACANL